MRAVQLVSELPAPVVRERLLPNPEINTGEVRGSIWAAELVRQLGPRSGGEMGWEGFSSVIDNGPPANVLGLDPERLCH